MKSCYIPTLEARIHLHDDRSNRRTKMLAFVELTIGGAFVIKSIRLLAHRDATGHDEPFIVFPADRGTQESSDRYYDVAHPCTAEARTEAVRVIMHAYLQKLATQAAP